MPKGLPWTDEIRLGFLDLWISFAKYPWFHKIGGENKKMAKDTINQLLDKQKIMVKGELLPVKEVSSSWHTIFDNLSGKVAATGKGKGFSFDSMKPFLQHVDDHMKGISFVDL